MTASFTSNSWSLDKPIDPSNFNVLAFQFSNFAPKFIYESGTLDLGLNKSLVNDWNS